MNQPALVLSLLVATSFAVHAAEQAIELESKTGTIKGKLTLPPCLASAEPGWLDIAPVYCYDAIH